MLYIQNFPAFEVTKWESHETFQLRKAHKNISCNRPVLAPFSKLNFQTLSCIDKTHLDMLFKAETSLFLRVKDSTVYHFLVEYSRLRHLSHYLCTVGYIAAQVDIRCPRWMWDLDNPRCSVLVSRRIREAIRSICLEVIVQSFRIMLPWCSSTAFLIIKFKSPVTFGETQFYLINKQEPVARTTEILFHNILFTTTNNRYFRSNVSHLQIDPDADYSIAHSTRNLSIQDLSSRERRCQALSLIIELNFNGINHSTGGFPSPQGLPSRLFIEIRNKKWLSMWIYFRKKEHPAPIRCFFTSESEVQMTSKISLTASVALL